MALIATSVSNSALPAKSTVMRFWLDLYDNYNVFSNTYIE